MDIKMKYSVLYDVRRGRGKMKMEWRELYRGKKGREEYKV